MISTRESTHIRNCRGGGSKLQTINICNGVYNYLTNNLFL